MGRVPEGEFYDRPRWNHAHLGGRLAAFAGGPGDPEGPSGGQSRRRNREREKGGF